MKSLGVLFTAMCSSGCIRLCRGTGSRNYRGSRRGADEPEAGAETVTELSDSLYDFQVKIGDKVYQFPMYYQDLQQTGHLARTRTRRWALEPITTVPSVFTKGTTAFPM